MEVNGHPLHIIFTPGNHDSAARLGFAAALMLPNVHMRCDIADIATPIMVDSADGEQLAITRCLTSTPILRVLHCRGC